MSRQNFYKCWVELFLSPQSLVLLVLVGPTLEHSWWGCVECWRWCWHLWCGDPANPLLNGRDRKGILKEDSLSSRTEWKGRGVGPYTDAGKILNASMTRQSDPGVPQTPKPKQITGKTFTLQKMHWIFPGQRHVGQYLYIFDRGK